MTPKYTFFNVFVEIWTTKSYMLPNTRSSSIKSWKMIKTPQNGRFLDSKFVQKSILICFRSIGAILRKVSEIFNFSERPPTRCRICTVSTAPPINRRPSRNHLSLPYIPHTVCQFNFKILLNCFGSFVVFWTPSRAPINYSSGGMFSSWVEQNLMVFKIRQNHHISEGGFPHPPRNSGGSHCRVGTHPSGCLCPSLP